MFMFNHCQEYICESHVKTRWQMAYFHMFFTYFSQAFHMHINFHIDVKFCIVK